jgi:hypothetical protein
MTHKTLIKFFFGISIISIIFWNRFLRERNPIELQNIILNPIRLCIIILLIVMFSFIIYMNIKVIFNIQKKFFIFENSYIKQTFLIVKEYIINAPEFLYLQVTKGKDYDLFLEIPVSYITAYHYYPYFFGIVLLNIPQCIVATTFIIDIFFFKELHYFFFSLNFFILLLSIRFLVFIVKIYSERRAYALEQYLNVEYTKEGGAWISLKPKDQWPSIPLFTILKAKRYFTRVSLNPKSQLSKNSISITSDKSSLDLLKNCWFIYKKISMYTQDIESVRNHWSPYFQLYTLFCYVLGWSFYLFIILNN